MRLSNKNEILPSRKNHLCAAAKGHTYTELEDSPTDRFSRILGITKCKQNHTVKKKGHTLQNPRETFGRNQTQTSGTETKTLLSRHHYLGATTKGYALIDATRSAVGTRPGGQNSAEADPSARTLDIAKRKPNNVLKRREQSKRDQILTLRIETKPLPSRRIYLCAAAQGNIDTLDDGTMGDAEKELVAAWAEIASLKANMERQGQELNFPNRPNNGYCRSDDQSSNNHSSSARWVPYKQNQFRDTCYGPENGWEGNRPRASSLSSGNHRGHGRGRNRAFSDGAYDDESYNDESYNDGQRSESRGRSRARKRRGRGGDPHGYNSARDREGGSSYGGSHDGGGSNGHGRHKDRSRSRNSRGGHGTDNSQKRAKLPQIILHNPDEWRYAIKKG
jgi:hypothetical protein